MITCQLCWSAHENTERLMEPLTYQESGYLTKNVAFIFMAGFPRHVSHPTHKVRNNHDFRFHGYLWFD